MIAKIISLTNKEAKGITELGELVNLKALNRQKNGGLFVGDDIVLGDLSHNVWTINSVMPRKNLLERPLIANLDQAFITVSISPPIDYLVLDKILINCQMNYIEPILVLNKSDLINAEFEREIRQQYSDCVKEIVVTNALDGKGLDRIKELMQSKTSAFMGQSAVGKSTILNFFNLGKLQKTNDLTLKAGKKTERGRNTTKASQLFALEGGFIADSPGFSKLDTSLIRPPELVFYYPDLMPHRTCKYSNCTHLSEGSDCGLQRAFNENKINKDRFTRFLKLQKMLIERWNKRYD